METSSTLKSSSSSSSVLFDELPRAICWRMFEHYQWEGFWYYPPHLEAAMAARSHFKARDDDIILASCPKTGTTWLKALIPSIINPTGGGEEEDDPLVTNHPNALMPSLEIKIYSGNPNPDLSGMLSPRLFRTHLPYSILPETIQKSGCKIVYIARDPKDAFVSLWHLMNANAAAGQEPHSIGDTFDSFCKGVHTFGPFHDHVLGYWNESLKRPEKILFLKYEEMKKDTRGQVKKLASYLGKPFVNEEEVDEILWRCSLERLKNLEVNKSGIDPWDGLAYKTYFRLGNVGDWKNCLTPEMKDRLDDITREKFQGSGLDL
ncbi:cytosolic sulfotransferase 5-like [Pistacia vera]|uniref:cytosolic sulfotransferase 5-like n=1 Tax=Pistacia vera TaxID=55513 RepID=UPI0012637C3A|nr:cytosolic sulfotransferase 5-like [Pistacia vera]XP_031280840.1 cytosolic sulfotransferase 5-like [Pistacia vera]